ncbi:MAG: hypothetical protein ACXVZ2_15190 [Gaiellaceae bacterium]
MARPLPTEPLPETSHSVDADAPLDAPLDSGHAIELRYRYHRARRNARVRRKQETRLARYRFYIVMLVLTAIAVAFVVGSWHEIQRLFGL